MTPVAREIQPLPAIAAAPVAASSIAPAARLAPNAISAPTQPLRALPQVAADTGSTLEQRRRRVARRGQR